MRYLGLLRAVNVGGKNTINMAELRGALEAIELQHVRTYIQSGNLMFDSDQSERAVRQAIERQIAQRFGFHIDVIVKTLTAFERVITDCPFIGPTEPTTVPSGLAVAFLSEPPDDDAVTALARYASSEEHFRVMGREVYLLLPRGLGRSKLVAQVHKLGPAATIRNWNTVQKLHALAVAR